MDRERLVRLNAILEQVSESGRRIAKYADCDSWFDGSDERVGQQVVKLNQLFAEAVEEGLIDTWEEPGESGTYWNWSVDALKMATDLGVTLVHPLSRLPLSEHPPNTITTPTALTRNLSIEALDNEVCLYLGRVYQEQLRLVICYLGKPVAAVVPIVDLEMLKDVEANTKPQAWQAWVQEIRKRLGWSPVTNDEEEGAAPE